MPKIMHAEDAAPGRGGRPRRVSTSLAEINVVPLVDVMLVLLIIFMVTAPMIQRGVDVKVPAATKAATQIDGERVFVTVPATYAKDGKAYLGDKAVTLTDLRVLVQQKMERQSKKEVYLRGESTITYQQLMEVFDQLKQAGVDNVGLITRLPQER